MRDQSERGGILGGLLLGGLIVLVVLVLSGLFVARNIRVEKTRTASGENVRIETPMGSVNVRASDKLAPDLAGVPVYPGAVREHDNSGGAQVDFDLNSGDSGHFSVVAAQYSTSDSAEKVREFYRAHLPNWTWTRKDGDHRVKVEYHEGGYKRFVAIEEKNGRTKIGIASMGEPGVN